MSPPESGSDGENGEKPVRERLKHTTIDRNAPDSVPESDLDLVGEKEDASAPEPMEGDTSNEKAPQKSAQKRTLEDAAHIDMSAISSEQGSKADNSDEHARKRTREEQMENKSEMPQALHQNGQMGRSTPPGRRATPTPAKSPTRLEAILTSPRKKRSRESLDVDDNLRHQKIPSTEETRARRSSSEERQDDGKKADEDKPPSEEKTESDAIPVFGTSLKPKPVEKPTEKPQTSSSAFAASGFASLSGSASLFGILDPSDAKNSKTPSQPKLSSFASSDKQSPSFGSSFAGSQSTFASASTSAVSGFGALGGQSFGGGVGAFGGGGLGTFGGGTRLTSFAAPLGDVKLGTTKPGKPFGAPAESDEESESDSDSEGDPASDDAPSKERKEEEALSPKFHVQEVQTGEDNEDSVYTNRAKLFQYHADSSSWKERGVGPVKVNVERGPHGNDAETEAGSAQSKPEDPNEHHLKARFVMRNHATHKVILNAPIYKEMKINEQTTKHLLFVCPNETGSMTTYMLRMGKEDDIKQLHRVVTNLQAKM